MPLALETLDHRALVDWLHETDPAVLEELWRRADAVRAAHVGDDVHLRGLIEISNNCERHCLYCGIRACAPGITRYRMTADEIVGLRQGRRPVSGTGPWSCSPARTAG